MTLRARRLRWFGAVYLVSLVSFLLATGLIHAVLWLIT
jgi:hypothetical protein